RLPAEDLVADRLVEKVADGQAGGAALVLLQIAAVALVEDALGFEQEGLPEPLGRDDDELVVPIRGQEAVDLGCPVEERFVDVLGHADVVGVNRPGSHTPPPRVAEAKRIAPGLACVQPARLDMDPTRGHGSWTRCVSRSPAAAMSASSTPPATSPIRGARS